MGAKRIPAIPASTADIPSEYPNILSEYIPTIFAPSRSWATARIAVPCLVLFKNKVSREIIKIAKIKIDRSLMLIAICPIIIVPSKRGGIDLVKGPKTTSAVVSKIKAEARVVSITMINQLVDFLKGRTTIFSKIHPNKYNAGITIANITR